MEGETKRKERDKCINKVIPAGSKRSHRKLWRVLLKIQWKIGAARMKISRCKIIASNQNTLTWVAEKNKNCRKIEELLSEDKIKNSLEVWKNKAPEVWKWENIVRILKKLRNKKWDEFQR